MKVVHTVLRKNIKLAWNSNHGETQQTKGLDNQLVTMAAAVQFKNWVCFPFISAGWALKKIKNQWSHLTILEEDWYTPMVDTDTNSLEYYRIDHEVSNN